MGFLRKMKSHFELRRLEKKYLNRTKPRPSYLMAEYVDGEYVYPETPTVHTPRFVRSREGPPQLVSSSAAFAASESQPHQTPASDITPWQQPPDQDGDSVPPLQFPHTPSHAPSMSSHTKHSSWTSLGAPSTTNSATDGSLSPPSSSWNQSHSASLSISRNSRGQTWEPPKQGWGGHGTDAFREDRKEFRFDVERDRRSIIRDEG